MIRLDLLPEDHPLRARPLGEIQAHYRYVGTKTWRQVFPTYRIAPCTFNQLGRVWLHSHEWCVEPDSPAD